MEMRIHNFCRRGPPTKLSWSSNMGSSTESSAASMVFASRAANGRFSSLKHQEIIQGYASDHLKNLLDFGYVERWQTADIDAVLDAGDAQWRNIVIGETRK